LYTVTVAVLVLSWSFMSSEAARDPPHPPSPLTTSTATTSSWLLHSTPPTRYRITTTPTTTTTTKNIPTPPHNYTTKTTKIISIKRTTITILPRVISSNLKLEGIEKCLRGGANMHEEQIYIKNIKKHYKTEKITRSQGGVISQLGWFLPPS